MHPPLIDAELVVAHKLRALRQARPGADFLMTRAVEDLGERLAAVDRRFEQAAAIHCLTRDARDALLASGKVDNVVRIEPDLSFLGGDQGCAASPEAPLPLAAQSLDLAVSLLALHEANDIPGMLFQIRRALRPDGLFLGVLAGAGTLAELRESLLAAETEIRGGASPRVLPFADVRDGGALLQRAGFALPVADIETVTVRYDTMFKLMFDLRAMGAANALVSRSRFPARRELFARAADIYAKRFSDPDGRIRATFVFVWLSGWAPHPAQPKPLQPGSAAVSLARVLNPSSN